MLIASGEPKTRDTAPMDASNALLSSKHETASSPFDGVSAGSISIGCMQFQDFRLWFTVHKFTMISM